MARTFEQPGDEGPVNKLAIWRNNDAVDDFATLKKNGFSIPLRSIKLQGQLAEGFEGDLLMEHHAVEELLASERVREVKGGRFDIKVNLMRGRNTFFLRSSKSPDDVYRLDVFYRSTLREWVDSILKALVLVLVVKTFVVQAFFIPTESMQSTLLVGDYLLVDKITYFFRDPKPGEIVVFEYPQEPQKDFIKRCVAVGGDRIAHEDDRLFVNGKALQEPYTQYLKVSPLYASDRRNFVERTVPEGTFFMMGDNRNNSQDSRFWGPLPRWRLIGRAFAGYWPLNRIGLISHTYGTPAPAVGPVAPQ
jgi:signal peptidase I